MAKQINPSLARLWQEHDKRRYGIENPKIIEVKSDSEARALSLLESGVTNSQFLDLAKLARIDQPSLDSLLVRLGSLVTQTTSFIPNMSEAEVERRFSEILRLFALGDKDPAETLRRRKLTRVHISSIGRTGFVAAKALLAMGIGQLVTFDATNVKTKDTSELGYQASQVGIPRHQALRELTGVPKSALQLHTRISEGLEKVDFALIIANDVIDPSSYQPWVTRDTPHLAVTFTESGAEVSQLVIPGQTPCLACNEVSRMAQDEDWLVVASQINRNDRDLADTSTLLAALGLAVGRMINFLDFQRIDVNQNFPISIDRASQEVAFRPDAAVSCGCRLQV